MYHCLRLQIREDAQHVNCIGVELLEFNSDFGSSTSPAPIPAAITACVLKKMNTDFKISPIEICEATRIGLERSIEARPKLEVAMDLIKSSHLNELRLQRNPTFVPLAVEHGTKHFDKETRITQRRLSNGIPVNYKGC